MQFLSPLNVCNPPKRVMCSNCVGDWWRKASGYDEHCPSNTSARQREQAIAFLFACVYCFLEQIKMNRGDSVSGSPNITAEMSFVLWVVLG